MESIIKIDNLCKSYDGKNNVLDGINVNIKKGEWVNIMGPSGSGKTTLLNILSCLDKPTSGSISICGEDITKFNQSQLAEFRRNKIGLIFQQYHLIPYLTSVENVMMAQYFHSAVDEEEAIEALKDVGLGHRLNNIPGHLSGGEQQRVSIARSLINSPEILMADEPTGNLDRKNGTIILDIFKKLHEKGSTIVLVTHDPVIGKMGDRTIEIMDGKIL
ncbi:ABC transporter ATP-binding protein [Clostridium kluyveri]|nr:ABC transporter ATP-binding protein [Clostridium kluyveri]UZQ48890.1 ABC transporter ATP-binding protein [Clostridium kluyveri]